MSIDRTGGFRFRGAKVSCPPILSIGLPEVNQVVLPEYYIAPNNATCVFKILGGLQPPPPPPASHAYAYELSTDYLHFSVGPTSRYATS